MKSRMEKFKLMKISLFVTSLVLAFTFLGNIALADGGISISPDSAFFNITNAIPGGEYSSDEVTITNSGTDAQQVQFSVDIKTNPKDLSQRLFMKVNDENGGCVANCDWAKNLDNITEILIGPLPAGSSKKYKFVVLFDKNAGNEFQGATTVFDIVIGYRGSDIVTPGDNDDDGDNNGEKKKKKKKKKDNVISVPVELTNTFFDQGTGGLIQATPTPAVGGVQGEESTNGEGTGTGEIAGEKNKCQSWPKWIWILALVIFAGIFGADARKNYVREEYGWKVALLWTVLAVGFWYYFDKCREFQWFLYSSIILAIVSHFSYLYFLRRKIGKVDVKTEIE